MASIKLELASSANPLTGLPGNVQIERELNQRLKRNDHQVVIYCDLDRFKWFNDRYGFEVGDQIIVRTANLLREASKWYGSGSDFIGHIGGDDFILITTAQCANDVVLFIMDAFTPYFSDIYEKRRMGDGQELSMSMAGVVLYAGKYTSAEQVAEKAAYVKMVAKAKVGTVFITDCELPGEEQIRIEG
ncbi:GGDEF domain-containing protein [Brevibacillus sp. FIR094]|uniref:GGDEF domain-containing protein n=1 Tax=Brevibacillus sp. FIR094 TaxID=3134809 RepID=UPI003D1E98DA